MSDQCERHKDCDGDLNRRQRIAGVLGMTYLLAVIVVIAFHLAGLL